MDIYCCSYTHVYRSTLGLVQSLFFVICNIVARGRYMPCLAIFTRTSLWRFFFNVIPIMISALPTSISASKTKKYLCFSNQFVLQTILTWTSHSFPAVLNKKEYYFVRLISFCHDSCMIERAHKFTLSSWLFHYLPMWLGAWDLKIAWDLIVYRVIVLCLNKGPSLGIVPLVTYGT